MHRYLTILCCSILLNGFSQPKLQSKTRLKTSITDIARGNPSFYLDHRLASFLRLQYGGGLTLDDVYALKYWEGEQYSKRAKFRDTRGSFAIGLNVNPFILLPAFYIGAEQKFRRYYCADGDFFQDEGIWLGAKRKERDSKFKVGFAYESMKGFVFDIGVGAVYFKSLDEWKDFYQDSSSQYPYLKGGEETVTKWMFCLDLQIGFGNKKY